MTIAIGIACGILFGYWLRGWLDTRRRENYRKRLRRDMSEPTMKNLKERDVPEKLIRDLVQPIAPHDPAEGFHEWWASQPPGFGEMYDRARAAWIASAERSKR